MTTQTLTSIAIIAVLIVAVFVMAFRLFRLFHLLGEVKSKLSLESEQKEHYKKKLAGSPTRQEFIEQSEQATTWMQKHDRLEENCEIIKQELYAAQNLNDVLHADNVNLESEIDRANEFITKAKSIMQRQRLVIEEAHWDFDELAKFAEDADKTGTISEYLKASRRNVLRTPAPIHLFPNPSFKKEDVRVFTPSEKTFGFLDKMINKASETLNERTNEVFGFSSEPTQGIDHQLRSSEGDVKLTHNDLMKRFVDDRLSVLEQQTDIDWSKPQAFPDGYEVPKGVDIVAIKDIVDLIKTGTKGITIDSSHMPDCNFENGIKEQIVYTHEISPIDPTDHPLHPDFNPNKYQS